MDINQEMAMSYLDKCTEGEWKVTRGTLGGLYIESVKFYSFVRVAHVGNERDAQLMAASKKMYEALDEVNSILSTLMESSNIRMLVLDDGEYDEAIEKANSALKAARGEK